MTLELRQLVIRLVIVCGVMPFGMSQQYISDVTHLSIEDGLSDRYVRKIAQDSKGFLWIPTRMA